jgi:chromosome partitioning protein
LAALLQFSTDRDMARCDHLVHLLLEPGVTSVERRLRIGRGRSLGGCEVAIVLFLNLKGGVAKTTCAVAVAETLAEAGNHVLVIDADHQRAASKLLLGEKRLAYAEARRRTLHDLLAEVLESGLDTDRLDSYIMRGASNIHGGIPNLAVLPCSLRIDDFTINMRKGRRSVRSPEEWTGIFTRYVPELRAWLLRHFDYTIIDCPPGIPMQVRTLLKAADGYVVPTVPDRLSLEGSKDLIDRLRRTGIKKHGLGTLWTLFKSNNEIHQRCVRRASWQSSSWSVLPKPFETVIPNATAIARASEGEGSPPSLSAKYEPQFAELFKRLSAEIVGRLDQG